MLKKVWTFHPQGDLLVPLLESVQEELWENDNTIFHSVLLSQEFPELTQACLENAQNIGFWVLQEGRWQSNISICRSVPEHTDPHVPWVSLLFVLTVKGNGEIHVLEDSYPLRVADILYFDHHDTHSVEFQGRGNATLLRVWVVQ